MPSAHRHSELHIWAKFHENPSKNRGDLQRTRNTDSNSWLSCATLTISCKLSAYHDSKTFEPSFILILYRTLGGMEWTRKTDQTVDLQLWPWPWAKWLSAHCFSTLNIWTMFHEILQRMWKIWSRRETWPSSVTLAKWQTNEWIEKMTSIMYILPPIHMVSFMHIA